jgi:hypothetical protein
MTQTQHTATTPRPWRAEGLDVFGNEPNGFICSCSGRSANAEFIVRACNCHDELVKTSKAISQQLGKAFVEMLQGDYKFVDELAHSNKIILVDGEPRVNIPILSKLG